MNLSTNARDAMPKGGTLLIELERQETQKRFPSAHGVGEPGVYAVISVTDTGTGMDEKTRQKLFEPFFTTKEVGRGTGLGLAIVYGIVQQHKGQVSVSSQVGAGTAFRIYLPAFTGQVESRAPVAVAPPVVTGTETILLAEDDAILRKFFRDILTEYGYTVIVAEDGEDAVRKYMAQRDRIQLCLLDMIMPRKSGKEVYDAVQKATPGARVIFLSGYTADKVQQQDLPPECSFILKPASPQVILSEVRSVLDRGNG
jgi:CheY-like chemotaxis protein